MDDRRGLGRLSPTLRLVVFAVLSTLFTFSSSWTTVLLSLVTGLVLLVAGRKYPRAALVGAWSAFVLTFLGNALLAREGELIFSWWVFRVSTVSLLTGLRLGLRITAMILPAAAFIAVTPRHEYLSAFRGLRIPPAAEMYLTIVLRYVDILWYEIQVSMKAMAMRGVDWQGGIRERVPAFRRLMLPLIFRTLEHIDGQSLAIDNRGGINVSRHKAEIATDKPAVSMRDVYVRYDAKAGSTDEHALSGIELRIEQKQTTVLMGRTGSGKTSALLLCTGLIPHSLGRMKGDVEIYGHNSKQAPLSQLGKLARIVFPSAVQGLVGLTVEDELKLSLRVSSLPAQKQDSAMVKALAAVGLDPSFLPRLTLGLSGGEMQRVALASAIVAEPPLLALDDVTVQLDPKGKGEVVSALQSLLKQHMTTVMTDPYVSLLQEAGERFVLLEEGRIRGDTTALEPQAIERAGLRVPQLMRLGQALGLVLPTNAHAALPLLRDRAEHAPTGQPSPVARERKERVSCQGLVFKYADGPTAVQGLDIALCEGELVAILGANGSGKTTTALLLAQAMEPDSGQILIEGQPVDRRFHRGRVAYVFQEPLNQVVTMKVSEELAFGPQQLGWDEDAVQRAVSREAARFDLPLDEMPLHLSPAEARKLAIAANLTMDPDVLILDEPTNNLDEDEAQLLMSHLRELRRSGTTVVVITHDVELACEHADRAIVMAEGKTLCEGPTCQVMAQPDLLEQSDVVVPPVVELSLALWPEAPPALSVDELASRLGWPAAA